MLLVGFLLLLSIGFSQQCTIQSNTNYNTAGDLVTLYGVASTAACCSACSTFAECSFFSYTKDSSSSNYKQCVIKSSSAKVAGTTASIDSGSVTNSYSRPTSCSQQDANTDYYLQANLGSAASSSASDCCAKCSAVVGCNYWTLSSGTCWFKANLGQKQTAAGVTSGTVIPTSVANTPKRTGKKGLGVYGTASCSDISKLSGVSWVYNWQETPGILEECYDQLGIQYVPMLWGLNAQYNVVYGNSPYLLTFNEPNFPDQSNMTPQQAAAAWPQVEAVAAKYGMQIGSPSASYGGANMDPIQWLDQFFAACSGCKVDFINTHQYDCNYYSLYGAITVFYKYNKPVWVTEYSCYGSSVSADVTFVNGIVPLFDNDAKIAKYAYFGSRSAGGAFIDVFDSTQSALTPVGVAYNSAV